MKKLVSLFGIIAFVAIIGFSVVACNDGSTNDNNNNNSGGGSGGLTGTWRGSIQGMSVIVTITASGWNFSGAGINDSGTYTLNGITANLYSTVYNMPTGSAVLIDSNTISLTLNQNSIAPGTYTLFRV
jgi:hypothetical protein